MKKIFFLFLIFPKLIYSQNNAKYIPLNYEYEISALSNNLQKNTYNTSIKPFQQIDISYDLEIDSFNNSFFNSNLLQIKKTNYTSYLNPILSSISYIESNKNFIYHNDLGFDFNLDFKHLSINYRPIYHILKFPDDKINQINETGVIPSFNNNYNFSSDFQILSHNLLISYSTKKYFNFVVGKGKNFLGEGYRSLFLSDQGASYPFIKTTVSAWKIKYVIQYTFLKDINYEKNRNLFEEKYAAIHYLTWNVFRNLDFHLFETVVWKGKDSLGYRGFDINYLNPVVFYRPIDFSLASPDNVIMGAGGKIRFLKNNFLYGQLVLDEFKLVELKADSGWRGNKFGIQVGIKSYKLFNISNLFFLSEVNIVKPFTYSHEISLQNYGNFFQPLAHPLGANFAEFITIINYSFKKSSLGFKYFNSIKGLDSSHVNYGGNIYRSYNNNINEYGNYILQGEQSKITYLELKYSYIVNPKWNLKLESGLAMRQISITNKKEYYLFFGFRTNLYNYNILFE